VALSDELLALYSGRGAATYFGEAVTTTEHSLQAAFFARASDAPDALVIAALLHDIGHLIDAAADDIAHWSEDARHEVSGSRWLAARFGSDVAEPVRLHVPAKRYLCATDGDFMPSLSAASIHSLHLQGGPMSATEVLAFETEPYFRDAIFLRRCDDRGKVAGLRTPDFAHYVELIELFAKVRRAR
jgi:[1-hydroxy-2-(trimethylamino)ethyl]phosphonate dioxygenase